MRHLKAKPTYDLVAKKIFSDEEITQHFIQDILDLSTKTIKILEGNKTQLMSKDDDSVGFYTAVDVLAELDNGTQVIIEVQVAKQTFFIQRLWAYICLQVADNFRKLRSSTSKTHDTYQQLCPVYTIAIVEQNYFDDSLPFHLFSLKENTTHQELIIQRENPAQSLVKLAFLELKKYDKDKITEYDKQKWYEFFNNEEFSTPPDVIIQRAENLLDTSKWSEEERQMLSEKERAEDHYLNTVGYWIEKGKTEGIIMGKSFGRAEGIKEGIHQGVARGIQQNIIELYQEKLISLEIACQKLQLTPEAFQQLLNEKY